MKNFLKFLFASMVLLMVFSIKSEAANKNKSLLKIKEKDEKTSK